MRGATSALQRPRCLPAHARPRSGSSSFQRHTLAISGVKETKEPSSPRTAQSSSRRPETACQSDGSTRSETGKSAARPTRFSQATAPRIVLTGRPELTARSYERVCLAGRVELGLVDEDAARLRAFVAADDPAPLEHVDQAAGARVPDAQAALDERDGCGLRLHDDLDRLVEQRVVVGVEVAVLAAVLVGVGEDLGKLKIALVELLLALARLLDDEGDFLLRDGGALDALES